VETCRYLAAKQAHDRLVQEIDAQSKDGESREKMHAALRDNPEVRTMLERSAMVEEALHSSDDGEEWILGAELFGTVTHYKKCKDDENAIIVKIEGTMNDLPLFEQMAVIHEIDLYNEWAPFCTDSVLVDKIGKAELYG
jgi:hypothetical protein